MITYKTQPAQPQFSAVFTDWDFAPRIATPVFTPELPAGHAEGPIQDSVRGEVAGGRMSMIKRLSYQEEAHRRAAGKCRRGGVS